MTLDVSSLQPGYRALIVGASGGIGGAIVHALVADKDCGSIHAAARSGVPSAGKVTGHVLDLTDESSIAAAVSSASAEGPLDLVVVATGLLHDADMRPEKTLRAITAQAMERAFQINAIGPALVAKHALPKLRKDTKAVFAALSARVGSIADNRLGGWHSYRASKAALNMIIKTCAIELSRTHPAAVCVALHPGTVDSALSKPFQAQVSPDGLFSAEYSASCLLSVLADLDSNHSGGVFAWDGERIPF